MSNAFLNFTFRDKWFFILSVFTIGRNNLKKNISVEKISNILLSFKYIFVRGQGKKTKGLSTKKAVVQNSIDRKTNSKINNWPLLKKPKNKKWQKT